MVNYDLPWNPNRLEQRFGRIHRIGQSEVCHLWNLVAKETREGDVYHRLLEKISVESEALKGRVFDILGEVFEEISLKDLLLQAIRYGDQPEIRARLYQKVENALDSEHPRSILDRNALAQESMSAERLFAVKEEMEKAEARRLQPFFIRTFFMKASQGLGGSIHPRSRMHRCQPRELRRDLIIAFSSGIVPPAGERDGAPASSRGRIAPWPEGDPCSARRPRATSGGSQRARLRAPSRSWCSPTSGAPR
jgi:superfamily II DNA/RNA helicase